MAVGKQTTDAELMAAVATQDEDALQCLIERFSPSVRAICRRMLKDPAAADDVAAEVFVELWTSCQRYSVARGRPRTYILMLTRSRCLDRLRARAARPIRSVSGDILIEEMAVGRELSPDESAANSDSFAHLRKSLSELSDVQRQSLGLVFFENLTHREVAERMQMPLGTVKTHIRVGMNRLRFLLRSSWGGPGS